MRPALAGCPQLLAELFGAPVGAVGAAGGLGLQDDESLDSGLGLGELSRPVALDLLERAAEGLAARRAVSLAGQLRRAGDGLLGSAALGSGAGEATLELGGFGSKAVGLGPGLLAGLLVG